MPHQSTINRAAAIIRKIDTGASTADQQLRLALRHADLSSLEKQQTASAVFAYYRWLQWLPEKETLQKRLAHAISLQAQFDKNPASIKPQALAARALPEWFLSELPSATPPDAFFQQLQRPPTLWIRSKTNGTSSLAQTLRPTRPADISALQLPTPPAGISTALAYTGQTNLFTTKSFQSGAFEIQDLASQLVSHACAPKPGETWWDACCGEGGKTLHLSDLMQNRGLIWATDRNTRRLENLRIRAARAGCFNYRATPWNGTSTLPTKTKFDGILIDAPCSGAGTWQRNPQARWTTTPRDVAELSQIQLQLLNAALPALKPGARLIYSVCTLTRSETTAIADTFSQQHPDLLPLPLFGTSTNQLLLWPHLLNSNSMFIAAWQKPQ